MASNRTPPWANADGLKVKEPNYYRNPANFVNVPRTIQGDNALKVIEIDVDLSKLASGEITYTWDNDNDGAPDGFQEDDVFLPKNSVVISAYWVSTLTAVGGTSVKIGTFQKDGTVIADNNIFTATELVTANMAVGMKNQGAGALTATAAGTAGSGSVDAYVAMTATGTYTAGKAKVIIKYLDASGIT